MSFFALRPAPAPRWPLATQAALGIAVPIAVMTMLGRPELGYVAAAGAFTVLFAAALPTVERARLLPVIAAALVACAVSGVWAARSPWLVGIGTVVVAAASAAFCFGFRLGPPGPVFFVLVFGLSAQVIATSPLHPVEYVIALAAGCVFSALVALTPLALARVRVVTARPIRELLPGPRWDADARMLLLRVLIVAIAGVLLALVVDPARSYWIVGAAVAVIGVAAGRRAALQRGVHRMLGTIGCAGVYALLVLLHPPRAVARAAARGAAVRHRDRGGAPLCSRAGVHHTARASAHRRGHRADRIDGRRRRTGRGHHRRCCSGRGVRGPASAGSGDRVIGRTA